MTKQLLFQTEFMNNQHWLFWGSSYDRGLQHLLRMWPEVIKAYPDAQLHVFYGWNMFVKGYSDNPERMKWMDKMNELMKQEGITHHGRVSKTELTEWQKKCGIFAYPTHFGETNCITALDSQRWGCVPCVIDYAGLRETVGAGIKVEGDIYDDDVYQEYLKQLIHLMGDEKLWKSEQLKGIEFAKDYHWIKIAHQWVKHFK
jgi:glycosyltransferase involved in cell wall biosynthesis